MRRRRSVKARVGRVYLALLSALVLVPIAIGAVSLAIQGVEARHAAGASAPPAVTAALSLLWTALWLALAARLGPVTLSPASVAWLLPSPLSRKRLLLPSLVAVLAAGAFTGWGNAAIAVLASAPSLPDAADAVGVGVASGVILAAILIMWQLRADGGRLVALWVALMCLAAVALTIWPWETFAMRSMTGPWGWAYDATTSAGDGAPAAAVLALVLAVVAWFFSGLLRHRSIAAGSSFAWILRAGIVTVDPGIAARAAEDIRLRESSPKHVGLTSGTGMWAVVRQDLLSLRRAPDRLILAAGLAALPVLLDRLVHAAWLFGVAWILCGLLATGMTTANARRDRDLPALTRLLGLPEWKLLAGRAVVPTIIATVWAAASLGWWAAVAGPALAAGAMRAARRGRVRHEFPPIVTPIGYIPTGLLYWAVTGIDLGLLLLTPTLLLILGVSAPLMIAAQALTSLLGLAALIGSRRQM